MKEKPLSEKKDFYSMRRKAIQDTMSWLGDGSSDKKILLKLGIKYGFGETFLKTVKELVADDESTE